MINLTVSNLTEQQVIALLSELISMPALSEVTAHRMRNRSIQPSEVISLLVAQCQKYNPILSQGTPPA